MTMQIGTTEQARQIGEAYVEDGTEGAAKACRRIFGNDPERVQQIVNVLEDGEITTSERRRLTDSRFSPVFVVALAYPASGGARDLRTQRAARIFEGFTEAKSQQLVKELGRLYKERPELVSALTGLLADSNRKVQVRAAESLGSLGEGAKSAVNALASKALRSDGHVAAAALRALAKIDPRLESPATSAAIKRALTSNDIVFRAAGLDAAKSIGLAARGLIGDLSKMIENPSAIVRWSNRIEATKILAKLGPEAEAALVLASRKQPLRDIAHEGLERIRKEKLAAQAVAQR